MQCNLCGHAEMPLFLEGNVKEEHLDRFSQYAYYGDLHRCPSCGLIAQQLNHQASEIIERLENERYLDETIGQLNVTEKHVQFDSLLSMVEEFCDLRDRTILDVGANTGVFLHQMKRYTSRLHGIEPSREAVRSAQENFSLAIRQGVIADLKDSTDRYDVITLWDVIEHLYDPRGDLDVLRQRLEPESGKMFISTHNIGDVFPRLTGRHYPMYMYQHFFHFSTKTLARMLEETGFRVLGVRFFRKSWSIRYLHELIGKNWPSNRAARLVSHVLGPLVGRDRVGGARVTFPLRHFFVIAAERAR